MTVTASEDDFAETSDEDEPMDHHAETNPEYDYPDPEENGDLLQVNQIEKGIQSNTIVKNKYKSCSQICDKDDPEIILQIHKEPESSEVLAMRLMEENPQLGDFFKRVIKEGIKEGMEEQNEKFEQTSSSNRGKEKDKGLSTSDRCNTNSNRVVQMVKSPSDMTLYTPALSKGKKNEVEMIEKISNFVEEIRLEGRSHEGTPQSRKGVPSAAAGSARVGSQEEAQNDRGARPSPKERTDQFLLEAKNFKVTIEPSAKGLSAKTS